MNNYVSRKKLYGCYDHYCDSKISMVEVYYYDPDNVKITLYYEVKLIMQKIMKRKVSKYDNYKAALQAYMILLATSAEKTCKHFLFDSLPF